MTGFNWPGSGSGSGIVTTSTTRGGCAAGVAASTDYVDMGRIGHYMLRKVDRWNDVAADGVLRVAATATV